MDYAVEVGDIVTVRGIVGEFSTNALNSLTQLDHIPGEAIVGVGQAPVPPAARIDTSMLYQGPYPGGRIQFTKGEPYESMIVELTDLVVPSYLNPGNGTFNMVQNGNMLSDYDASDYYTLRRVNPPGWTYALPPLQSEIATIRGAVWVLSGGNNARGYHIAPVFPGDLVLAGTLPLADSAARSPWVGPPDSDVVVTVHAAQQPFGAPIDSVVLYYGVDDAPFVAQQMTLINPIDSIYQGVIPKSPDSSFVRYFFKAYASALKSTSLANYSPAWSPSGRSRR